jgi:hypothetical protein
VASNLEDSKEFEVQRTQDNPKLMAPHQCEFLSFEGQRERGEKRTVQVKQVRHRSFQLCGAIDKGRQGICITGFPVFP